MKTYLPGGGAQPVMPGAGYDVEQVNKQINEVGTVAATMYRKLLDTNATSVNDVLSLCAQLQAKIQGTAGLQIDAINAVCNKISDKIQRKAITSLQQVYNYLGNAGYDIQAVTNAVGPVPIVQPGDGTGNPSLIGGTGNDVLPSPEPGPQLQPVPIGGTFPPVIAPPQSPPAVQPVPVPVKPPPAFQPPPTTQPPPSTQPPPTGKGGLFQPPPSTKPGGTSPGQQPPPVIPPGVLPSGGSPDNPCPPGFIPNPNYVPPAPPPVASGPGINFGWAPPGQFGGCYQHGTQFVCQPAGSGESIPGGGDAQLVCVSGNQLRPPQYGVVQWWIPTGMSLWVDTLNGEVGAASAPWDQNVVPVPTVPCQPGFPDPIYNPPVPGSPADPAGSGGSPCIPAPPPTCDPGGSGGGGGGGAGSGGQPPPPVCGGPPIKPPPPPPPAPPVVPPALDRCGIFDDYMKGVQATEMDFASFIGMANPKQDGMGTIDGAIADAIIGQATPMLPWLVQRFAGWMTNIVKTLAQGVQCDPIALTPVLMMQMSIRFIEKYIGIVPDQLSTSLDQLSNYACQYLLPDVSAAHHAYLKDQIDKAAWECWVKAAGAQLPEAQKVRDSQRTRPTPHQAQELFRRGWITQERYDALVRQGGVIQDDDKTDLWAWTNAWPSEGDLTRWAGEFTFDDDTVSRFHLDDQLDTVYADRLQHWWEGHGADKEQFQYHWRAHWQRPGVGELIEMVRRLRPADVDQSVAFGDDDLDAALKQEGWNDYWRPRIKAISHRVAQRRDVQRLYDYHIIDEDGMKQLLLDQGYEGTFADQLVQSWKIQRNRADLTAAGYPSMGELNRLYGQCLIDQSTLQDGISKWTTNDDQANEAMEASELNRTITERKTAIKSIQQQFRLGQLSDDDASKMLADIGIDPGCIGGMVGKMRQQRQRQPKQVAAGTLCKWFKNGIITADGFLLSLTRIGWAEEDALRIVKECEIEQEQAAQKAQQAAAAKAAKVAASEAKAAAKAAKPPKTSKT